MRRKSLPVFKIGVIGRSFCGKSSIVEKFISGKFSSSISLTLGVDMVDFLTNLETNGNQNKKPLNKLRNCNTNSYL